VYANSVRKLHSTLFTFLIGKNEVPVIVHSGVVAALSSPLECLVRESQENVVRFPDLEVCDFERICEFAYTGDYTKPEATRFSDSDIDIQEDFYVLSESIAQRESDHEHFELASSFICSSYGGLKLIFDSHFRLDRAANGWAVDKETRNDASGRSQAWRDDITDITLGNARIYVFASEYLIVKLKYLSLHKLHTFLADLRIFPLTRDPIIKLIGYIYNNENISDRGEEERHVDLLRKLVIEFVGLHRKEFIRFPGHRAALKLGNEYAMDFLDHTEHMLLWVDRTIDTMRVNEENETEQDEGHWS
jgi:hypothetical protein